MCTHKPMPELRPAPHCLFFPLKPTSPSRSLALSPPDEYTCILSAFNGALLSCKLAWGRSCGGGLWTRGKQRRLSLLSPWWGCWPGSLHPPPHTPNPLLLQLGFDMLKYRERDRENGVFERESLHRRGIRHVRGEWACTLECVDCAALQAGVTLRQSWTHRVNDFSCMWDSPLLKLSALNVLKSLRLFLSPFLSSIQSLFPVVNILLPLLLSACVDLSLPLPSCCVWQLSDWVLEKD